MFKGENLLVGLIAMGLLMPPLITVGVATLAKTIAFLTQKTLGWGLALLMGFGMYLVVLTVSVALG